MKSIGNRIISFCKKINCLAFINVLLCVLNMKIGIQVNAFFGVDNAVKMFFIVVAFLTGNWLGNHWRELSSNNLKSTTKILFLLLCCYAAFTLVGNPCFVYPLTMKSSILQWMVYLLAIVWISPIMIWLCYYLIYHKPVRVNNNKISIKIIVAGTIALGSVFAVFMVAYNPCIGTYDTVYNMELAVTTGARGMIDYQPPFYIIWLEGILTVWKSPYAVVLVQLFSFLFIFWKAILLFWKKGLSKHGILKCMLFVVVSVNILIFLITIWKDIPYTLAILWLTVILAYFLSGEKQWYLYVEYVLALVGVFFFRQNGIVPFVLVCISVPLVIRNAKIWGSVLAAVLIVILIKFPLYSSMEINHDNGGMTYVGMGQDIINVYYNGGTLSKEADDFVMQMIQNPDEYIYSPYGLGNISTNIDISTKEFVKIYLETFVRNPLMMIRGILCRNDGVWNLFDGVGGGVQGAAMTRASEDDGATWLNYFPGRRENGLTEKLNILVAYATWKDVTGMFMGRVGVWTLILVVSIFVLCCKRQYKYLLVTLPCIGHILSMILAVGWPSYRYMTPIEFMSVFILVFVWLLERKGETSI